MAAHFKEGKSWTGKYKEDICMVSLSGVPEHVTIWNVASQNVRG